MSLALPAPDITRALTRISHEILERNSGSESITLLGIPTRGAHLAKRFEQRSMPSVRSVARRACNWQC